MKIITGGVTAAKGFQAASTAAGIKYQGRTDMAMVYSEETMCGSRNFYYKYRKGSSGQMGSGDRV